jgi:hypothetical protein
VVAVFDYISSLAVFGDKSSYGVSARGECEKMNTTPRLVKTFGQKINLEAVATRLTFVAVLEVFGNQFVKGVIPD